MYLNSSCKTQQSQCYLHKVDHTGSFLSIGLLPLSTKLS